MTTISFPGIGIEDFQINSVAFSIGKLEIRWYGIIIMSAIILAVLYCAYRAKQEGIKLDDLLDMAIFTVVFSVIGARLYYVLMTLGQYKSFLDLIAIWEGGLAIYGAVIAGAITIYLVCKVKKINCLKAFDMVSPALLMAQAIGRWGNFFNGEAYGREIPEDSLLYFIRMGIFPNEIEGAYGMAYVHPTFLYESLWNIAGFIIINTLYKKKKFDGQVFLMSITWYGFGRMFIEGLRIDSLYLGVFRISQVVAFICVVAGAILLIYNLAKFRRQELTKGEYEPAYPKFSHMPLRSFSNAEDNDEDENEINETENNTNDNEKGEN